MDVVVLYESGGRGRSIIVACVKKVRSFWCALALDHEMQIYLTAIIDADDHSS